MTTSIRELKREDRALVPALAALHKRAFPGFFLTRLGLPFLRTLYRGYLEDPDSGILIAERDGTPVGFLAYSQDYPRFYKGLIRRHVVRFALCSALAAIRHPSFIKRIFGAFRKSEAVVKEEAYVELASICVDPASEGAGVGTALIDRLKERVDFERFAYINLETDADGNDAVNRFYQKNGFVPARQFVTAEGRSMNEYRFAPEETR